MMFKNYEVGQPFESGVSKYAEHIHFDFMQSGAVLTLFFSGLAEKEIRACKDGDMKTGFLEKDDVIFMLFRFEEMKWVDAPYTIHLSQPFEFIPLTDGMGFGLQIYLIDADTGILKVIRYIGFGTEFSIRFKDAVLRQKAVSFDKKEYDTKIQSVYDRYSTDQLVEMVLPKDFYRIRK